MNNKDDLYLDTKGNQQNFKIIFMVLFLLFLGISIFISFFLPDDRPYKTENYKTNITFDSATLKFENAEYYSKTGDFRFDINIENMEAVDKLSKFKYTIEVNEEEIGQKNIDYYVELSDIVNEKGEIETHPIIHVNVSLNPQDLYKLWYVNIDMQGYTQMLDETTGKTEEELRDEQEIKIDYRDIKEENLQNFNSEKQLYSSTDEEIQAYISQNVIVDDGSIDKNIDQATLEEEGKDMTKEEQEEAINNTLSDINGEIAIDEQKLESYQEIYKEKKNPDDKAKIQKLIDDTNKDISSLKNTKEEYEKVAKDNNLDIDENANSEYNTNSSYDYTPEEAID